ncbi:exosortase/archaeosortase family protein [Patescibacteria group bacterium]
MKQKHTFKTVFLVFALTMIFLPFMVSFNEVLTKVAEKFILYRWVQETIVPMEVQLVGVIVAPFKINYVAYKDGMTINGLPMQMTWNCLGWQSLILFAVSLIVGLKGKYPIFSKIEALGIGILGIFWANLIRVSFTVILAAYAPPIFRIVFHDYLAAFTTILFLLVYWWFVYSFIFVDQKVSYEKA